MSSFEMPGNVVTATSVRPSVEATCCIAVTRRSRGTTDVAVASARIALVPVSVEAATCGHIDNPSAFALQCPGRYLISKLNDASAAAHLCSTADNLDFLRKYASGLLSV